ncbi:putative ribonuclease, partial [Gordonia hirsuta DSM 44140 = NBRC 16056]
GRGDAADQDGTDRDEAAEDGTGEAKTEGASATDTDGAAPDGEKTEDGDATSDDQDTSAGAGDGAEQTGDDADSGDDEDNGDTDDSTTPTSKRRRRRRRRRTGSDSDEGAAADDPPNTVVHEREPRARRQRDEVQGISGSTRLEAKRQRRRDGRDAGRRRPPILTESEFLARREAVERMMVVRERRVDPAAAGQQAPTEDYTQVAVLEDGVLVEHFVTTETSQSMVGNIYLGRVQNVLPGMEAAFVDIGRGRNGVLYAGEVNWEAAGLDGGARKIEQALKPGDSVLVQVSKDPVGHKGARLTTQISLAGRYLVYVPGGTSTGISRKLPDTERKRLKSILAKLVPAEAGVIVRTASEGVSADELGADIARLEAQWKGIEAAAEEHMKKASGTTRALYEEPDLLVRVVRDLFNEDFTKLVVEGEAAWNLISGYVESVAPDLSARVVRFQKETPESADSFGVHRIDEQLTKALDRKVWLPSGGTLIIEHTEAMTVVDVNTGKFTGSGGNLEETVTRNNLEAAEEIVRQMRLRDIGGMIVVDFIDMVLESNRDLVLRRLTEALARDRTRHQVSEVTSLGLVQMTRKRLGTGLLEAFSTTCTCCQGRGLIVHASPVEVSSGDDGRGESGGSKRSRRKRGRSDKTETPAAPAPETKPNKPAAEHPLFKAMAHTDEDAAEQPATADTPAAATEVVTAEVTEAVAAQQDGSGRPEVAAEPAEPAAPVVTRRRRAARRAAAPTAPAEPIVVTPAEPTTTVAAQTTEPVVEVTRTPRRRRGGRRAAGAPATGDTGQTAGTGGQAADSDADPT